MIRREPVGVVGQIAPWNYPLLMAIWKIGPALATGNTIVLKPAETTPLTTLRLGELANEILPAGVLNVVTGAGETGQRLVTHPDVDMVSLTGSVETGKWIAARRRRHAQARPPRARRQGAGRGLRRRRPRSGRGTGSPAPATTTPARTARRRPACSSPTACTTTSSRRWPSRPAASRSATRPTPRRRSARSTPPASARTWPASSSACPTTRGSSPAASSPTRPGFFLEPTVVEQPPPRRRARPARGLRPGHHRPALQRRGAGDRVGQRHRLRPRVVRLDARHRPRAARREGAALRLRVDQRPHPARLRDAAWRLQAVRLRQGPLDVRARGLHGRQARHGKLELIWPPLTSRPRRTWTR